MYMCTSSKYIGHGSVVCKKLLTWQPMTGTVATSWKNIKILIGVLNGPPEIKLAIGTTIDVPAINRNTKSAQYFFDNAS